MKEQAFCDCTCHGDRHYHHIGPCCDVCPHCHRNIRLGFMHVHEPECLKHQATMENLFKDAFPDE